MSYAVVESLDLGIHSHLSGRQARNAHLHLDKLHARLLFRVFGDGLHLADSSLGEILYAILLYGTVD